MDFNKSLYNYIHFYKSKNDSIRIQLNDRITDYNDIPNFLTTYDQKHAPKVLVFLGKGINLSDLKQLYFHLKVLNINEVKLATKKKGWNDYYIITDENDVRWSDLENNLNYLPPPTPYDVELIENNFKNNAAEINIETKLDFSKLDLIKSEEKYLISIDESLPIVDYLELKLLLKPIRERCKNVAVKIN